MLTYVHYLWILLSLLIAITCTYCLLQPEWFVHPDSVHAFGVYAFCVEDSRLQRTFQRCDFYGGRFGFGNIPSTPWQAACLLYGGGCMFMCIASVCSLGTMCVKNGCDKTLVLLTRYLQTAAGMKHFNLPNLPRQVKKCPRTCAQSSSYACAKYHPGLCSTAFMHA